MGKSVALRPTVKNYEQKMMAKLASTVFQNTVNKNEKCTKIDNTISGHTSFMNSHLLPSSLLRCGRFCLLESESIQF